MEASRQADRAQAASNVIMSKQAKQPAARFQSDAPPRQLLPLNAPLSLRLPGQKTKQSGNTDNDQIFSDLRYASRWILVFGSRTA